jgi:crotonobetaine/carnitine-CoA ligase
VGSIGKPLPHVSVKVVDEMDREVDAGVEGEIVVREEVKHTQFQGYYKMPDKTAEAMKGGWFHTGDRGVRDKDGYFYFKDRLKDCIRYRGKTSHPSKSNTLSTIIRLLRNLQQSVCRLSWVKKM